MTVTNSDVGITIAVSAVLGRRLLETAAFYRCCSFSYLVLALASQLCLTTISFAK